MRKPVVRKGLSEPSTPVLQIVPAAILLLPIGNLDGTQTAREIVIVNEGQSSESNARHRIRRGPRSMMIKMATISLILEIQLERRSIRRNSGIKSLTCLVKVLLAR